jgi:hypothetical protein
MAPFADVPRKTAGGVGELADKGCGGTGTMPKACSVGSDETGSCTGIALVPEADEVGTGIDVSEAGVKGEGAIGAEAGPAVEAVAADCVLIVEVPVARTGGTYCEMVELSGTE